MNHILCPAYTPHQTRQQHRLLHADTRWRYTSVSHVVFLSVCFLVTMVTDDILNVSITVKDALRSHEEKENKHRTAPSSPTAAVPTTPTSKLSRSVSHSSTFYTRTPSYDHLESVSEQDTFRTTTSGNTIYSQCW